MLGFGVGNRVEAADTHDFSNRIAAAVVGIRVGAQNTAKICFQPKVFGRLALLASLVHAVALDCTGDRNVHTHIESRECIIAAGTVSSRPLPSSNALPKDALYNLGGCAGSVLFVCESINVGRETRRGRRIDTSDMMIDARLLN